MDGFFSWSTFFSILYLLNLLLALWIMVKVVLNNRTPVATFAWIFVLLFIPYLGSLLYFLFGTDTRKRKYIRRRFLSQIQQYSALSYRSYSTKMPHKEYSRLVAYLENAADAYTMQNTAAQVIGDTRDFMTSLLSAIENAQNHIHVQFYIFEDDELGGRVRDALVQKARDGVQVRVIYDSVGCWSVSPAFFDKIRRSGGYVESFLKVRFPLLTNKVNYRNHRKIVVVDGKVGFVGGCNIADRYIKGINGGCWRDTMLMLQGDGVYALQTSFLVDWYFANGSLVSGKEYFPRFDKACGACHVQLLTSNPVMTWRAIPGGITMALSHATSYFYLQTPYLLPNEKVMAALQNAALSGVDVRLMIPLHSDSRLADYASRSYIEGLLSAGVKVYLYTAGFLHAKTFVSDDMLSVVGSANLDFRSFDYNFEVSAYVYDQTLAKRMKSLFIDDMSHCMRLTLREFKERSFGGRCLESAARLLSPVL